MERFKLGKAPILNTQDGLPNAFLIESHELQQRRMTLLEGIACGEMAISESRVISHAEAKAHMSRWLK